MKKTLRLMLLFVLSIFMVDIVSAADSYTITINNSNAGHTYEAYQIFKGTLSTGNVLSDIEWGNGVTSAGQTALGNAKTVAGTLTSETTAKAFAKTVSAYLNIPTATTDSLTNNKYVISGLEPGYYLIKDKDTSLDGKHDAYTEFILRVVADSEVTPKSAIPIASKNIVVSGNNKKYADFSLGDTVNFELTGTIAKNYDSYSKYYYVFHDNQATGLTFDASSVKVYVDNVLITEGYEVKTTGLTDGDTFELIFADTKSVASIKAESTIKVTYQATVNNTAVMGNTTGNTNTVKVEYSNNPNNNTSTGTTVSQTVYAYTFQLIFNKVDESSEPLAGATFKLEKYNGTTWDEIALDATSTETSFIYSRLGTGKYRLTEVTPPTGYNTLEPITFDITGTYDGSGLTALNANALSFTANLPSGTMTTPIVNIPGSSLPLTGGIGTTIFTVLGLILIGGAVCFFVYTNKKKDK